MGLKNKNLEVRRNVLKTNKGVPITITAKSPGKYETFKGGGVPLSVANPQAILAIHTGSIQVKGQKGSMEDFMNGKRIIDNINEYRNSIGGVFELRLKEVDTEGKEHYEMFMIIRENLSTESATTVLELVKTYLYSTTNSSYKQLAEDIKQISNVDVTNFEGFTKMLSRYIRFTKVVMDKDIKSEDRPLTVLRRVMNDKGVLVGRPFYAFEKGVLYYGIKKNGMSVRDVQTLKSFEIQDLKKMQKNLEAFESKGIENLSELARNQYEVLKEKSKNMKTVFKKNYKFLMRLF